MSFFNSLSVSAVLAIAALVPAVNAHISMFHPSMYGFNRPDPQTVYPLANQGFNGWWFHGNLDDPPRETMSINPGSTINIELTCGKHYSSWGGGSTWESCPNDQGSYHAGGQGWGGWGQNQDSNLMGCALAIAYKSDAWSVRPEDFIVMSVQENCVKQRDTPFEIPSNLPACPEGGCTCAWFWQGQNSAEEMYMTGFKCDINGGAIGANIPQPRRPRQEGNSDAATQPYYWANYDNQNVDWQVGWNSRPKYNGKMGWRNGAQTNAFANAGGSPGNGNSAPTPSSSPAPAESSSSRRRPRPAGNGNGPEFPNYAAGPLESSSATAPSPSPTSAPTPENGSETGHTSPSGPEHKPCKKVRRRRRSRVRRAAHHATNAARH